MFMKKKTLDREIGLKWLAALRSGKFPQGPRYLKSAVGKYCCLGVLCEVQDPQWQTEFPEMGTSYVGRFNAGLVSGHTEVLSLKNDNGVPFTLIADFIEANYLKDAPEDAPITET